MYMYNCTCTYIHNLYYLIYLITHVLICLTYYNYNYNMVCASGTPLTKLIKPFLDVT